MKTLLSKKLINPRIARWALELENFDYQIQHRRGELMAYVDALSRAQIVAVIGNYDDVYLNIQMVQNKDEIILATRSKFEKEEMEGYVLENGIVFCCGVRGYRQLYVPAELKDNVKRLTEKYGYVGVEKTMNQIRKYFWLTNMRDKITQFMRNCLKCIYYSTPHRKNERNFYNI